MNWHTQMMKVEASITGYLSEVTVRHHDLPVTSLSTASEVEVNKIWGWKRPQYFFFIFPVLLYNSKQA